MNFSQVQSGLQNDAILLIDVRNSDELRNQGRIPGSHNVPLPTLKEALQLSESDFQSKFGFPKPGLSNEKPIVVSCRSGARAQTADDILKKCGYNNVMVYSGSFMDWTAKGGQIVR